MKNSFFGYSEMFIIPFYFFFPHLFYFFALLYPPYLLHESTARIASRPCSTPSPPTHPGMPVPMRMEPRRRQTPKLHRYLVVMTCASAPTVPCRRGLLPRLNDTSTQLHPGVAPGHFHLGLQALLTDLLWKFVGWKSTTSEHDSSENRYQTIKGIGGSENLRSTNSVPY